MNALLENPAQLLCPLDNKHILSTRLLCFDRGGQAGRAGADNDHIISFL
jgi:hypothetical protein